MSERSCAGFLTEHKELVFKERYNETWRGILQIWKEAHRRKEKREMKLEIKEEKH